MTSLGELLKETHPVDTPRTPLRVERFSTSDQEFSLSTRDEQICALVHQLFFQHISGPVRSVGFTPIEIGTETARLCFDVARALVEEGRYDVGLIDASLGRVPLADQLEIPSPANPTAPWGVAQRLWLVPRESWCNDLGKQPLSHRNLELLRDYVSEFDFSILHCRPISWLTARIGQNCDGLVLVLTANKTRRLVAAQVKEQLNRAHVSLLGSVLAERRFPVPSGLYRSL
ncbi:MAG TPA: hypothetical protein VL983_09355 [Terriglobales bacterium]|nr:hypothetical protein [Terriglobales bacterium]